MNNERGFAWIIIPMIVAIVLLGFHALLTS